MPWSGESTPFGFSSGKPWLPIPNEWREFSVSAQNADSASTLNLYRSALKFRKNNLVGLGGIEWVDRGASGLISFTRGEFAIYLNTSNATLQIPTVGNLVLGSDNEVVLANGNLILPAASAAWVAIR
jgi:alpha-glucosidase